MKNEQWQIDELINIKRLKEELSGIIDGADDFFELMREDDPELDEQGRWEQRELALEASEEEIRRCMKDNLCEWFILSPKEMTNVFYSRIDYENIDFELLFGGFIEQLENQIATRKTGVLKLSDVKLQPQDSEGVVTLADFKIRINLNRWLSCNLFLEKKEKDILGDATLCAQVDGIMSEESCTQLEDVLKKKFSYLLGAIVMMSNGMRYFDESGKHFETCRGSIDSMVLEENYRFIAQYIELWFSREKAPARNVTKKERGLLSQQIKTAIELLQIAFDQERKDIKFVLSFTAMESLLSKKDDTDAGITEQLARNIVMLLEPDANNRKQHIKNVKDLYGMRSKMIHGSKVDEKNEYAVMVHWLAFRCLKAVVQWKICQEGVDPNKKHNAKKDDLMSELEDALYLGKKIVGVSDRCDYNWLKRIGEEKGSIFTM